MSASPPALTVVGCGPAWGNPGEPCSSYLVEAGGARILLDCGSGAFAALMALDARPLDAVVLSHLHFDHCADLIPFAYSRRYAALRAWAPPRLVAPPAGLERLASLAEAGGASRDHLAGPFPLEEYRPGTPLEIGAARLTVAALRHPGVSHAIRVEAGGKALCFSGDTGLTPGARRARARRRSAALRGDLLRSRRVRCVHLAAADAGAAAAAARAGRLVLTHVDAERRTRAVAAARTAFGGPVDAAAPGVRFPL